MYAHHGCFVKSADMLENTFFGISSPEVLAMDPRQRVLLEEAHGALANTQMPQCTFASGRTCTSST